MSDKDWNSWIWQQKNRIKDLKGLEKVIDMSSEELEAYEKCHESFNVGITPYYAILMDRENKDCPVRQNTESNHLIGLLGGMW